VKINTLIFLFLFFPLPRGGEEKKGGCIYSSSSKEKRAGSWIN
jgi:hypothetical protein